MFRNTVHSYSQSDMAYYLNTTTIQKLGSYPVGVAQEQYIEDMKDKGYDSFSLNYASIPEDWNSFSLSCQRSLIPLVLWTVDEKEPSLKVWSNTFRMHFFNQMYSSRLLLQEFLLLPMSLRICNLFLLRQKTMISLPFLLLLLLLLLQFVLSYSVWVSRC